MRFYVESNQENEATQKIDWLQTTYQCCGVESSQDWRAYNLYGGGSGMPQSNVNYNRHPNSNFYSNQQQLLQQTNQIYFGNQFLANVNYPFMDKTPDSCCTRWFYNCGKTGNRWPNSGNMYGQNLEIYTQGCMSTYYYRWVRDVRFISGLCVAVSCLAVVSSVLFAGLYFFLKKRATYA